MGTDLYIEYVNISIISVDRRYKIHGESPEYRRTRIRRCPSSEAACRHPVVFLVLPVVFGVEKFARICHVAILYGEFVCHRVTIEYVFDICVPPFELPWKRIHINSNTFSDKISADKIFGGLNFSADKIFGTKSKFRQFCPTKFFHRFLISPYNSQEKYV